MEVAKNTICAPPRVFLDTQIVIDVERGHIAADNWARASDYLRHTSQYSISAITLTELLVAMANAKSEFFENHKRRLRILLTPGIAVEVFDFIPYFVARELGLAIHRPEHLESDFVGAVQLILAAPSKEHLLNGFTPPNTTFQKPIKIRIDRFLQELANYKAAYIKLMGFRQGQKLKMISQKDWSINLLRAYGAEQTPRSIQDVSDRLSATYEFEMAVNKLIDNPNFTVAKNASDLCDGQQLCYLCGSDVIFITNDSDFKSRTRKSPQTNRIRTFAELLSCAECGSQLLPG